MPLTCGTRFGHTQNLGMQLSQQGRVSCTHVFLRAAHQLYRIHQYVAWFFDLYLRLHVDKPYVIIVASVDGSKAAGRGRVEILLSNLLR